MSNFNWSDAESVSVKIPKLNDEEYLVLVNHGYRLLLTKKRSKQKLTQEELEVLDTLFLSGIADCLAKGIKLVPSEVQTSCYLTGGTG